MKTILVIEDNMEVRENIAEILELSNYNVLTAQNGKIGVRMVQENAVDLIICDVMMPELDGFGVIHILSQQPQTAKIPFIFLTAKAEKSDFRKGMNLGADDYLTKPFEDVDLLNAIDTRLKKQQLIDSIDNPKAAQSVTRESQAQCLALLDRLIEDSEKRLYTKRDTIYREHDYPRYIFFLHSGKVKLSKVNDDGKEFILHLGKAGDYLGFLPLVHSSAYTETAIVLEDCEVSLIPQQQFLSTLNDHPDLGNIFIKILAENLAQKEEQLVELAYNSVRKRVADALVRLQERYQEQEDKKFTMAILREDLASMVGTAKETVIRTLSDFRDENLIEMKGSKITILNAEALKNMLN